MLEIPPLSPAYPVVIKPEKIKKDRYLPDQPQHKKKQALAGQAAPPEQHIDEIV
jgi:hypothetical protein